MFNLLILFFHSTLLKVTVAVVLLFGNSLDVVFSVKSIENNDLSRWSTLCLS
ncbi:hypothetical protein CPS_1367 [Colwellia psychrerythraea 34H]|uniref:Uncharacterized protein n=1 Tax=Colwellia psychrerythraea (strain 34H / ATCC BAA-681) TaxID=167879 RepID=Q486A5_COLP3|nr:hypothetical protein CPS_1367 [Colwellia psychrerythraea 34H]